MTTTSITTTTSTERPSVPNVHAPTAGGAPSRRLRAVLAVNAAMSAATGLVMAAAPGSVDELLDTGRPGWVRLVGIGLVLFGIDVGLLSRASRRRLRRFTPAIIAADFAWVAASVAAMALGWFSGTGAAAVLAVAIAVDAFATLQLLAWRHLRTHG